METVAIPGFPSIIKVQDRPEFNFQSTVLDPCPHTCSWTKTLSPVNIAQACVSGSSIFVSSTQCIIFFTF